MKANEVDVLVYINAIQKQEGIPGVVEKIQRMAGVIQASISPRLNRLLAVKYDPRHISAPAILNGIKHNGITASLIGM